MTTACGTSANSRALRTETSSSRSEKYARARRAAARAAVSGGSHRTAQKSAAASRHSAAHCGPAPRHRPQPPPAPTGPSACRRSSATHCAARGDGRAHGAAHSAGTGPRPANARPPARQTASPWNAPRSRPSHAVRAVRQMPAGSAPARPPWRPQRNPAHRRHAPAGADCRRTSPAARAAGRGQTARATRECRARTAPRRLRQAEGAFPSRIS